MYHLIFIVKIKNNMRVCILGSSLSSLTLAKALVNQKIYVDLISSKNSKKSNQTRTIGISKSNIEFFNKNIIDITKIIWKLKKIQIYSDNLKNEKILNFENNNQLFSIVENRKLILLLQKSLSKNIYFKKINTNNKLLLKNYDIVINTDYFNPITKKYFNKRILKKYNSYAVTTIIEHEKIINNIATQIFTKIGPLAFLPISNNKTSIVYSIYNSKNNNKQNINELIKSYNFKYKINKIQKLEHFELNSISLRSYYFKNILAFGDLLHRVHPLAGQGFNMTIRDVRELIKIIKKKIDLGLPIDISVNDEFEKKMKHKNFIFSNGINLIHEFFKFDRKTNSNFFGKSVRAIGKNHLINKFFTQIADEGI